MMKVSPSSTQVFLSLDEVMAGNSVEHPDIVMVEGQRYILQSRHGADYVAAPLPLQPGVGGMGAWSEDCKL